jgi:hypothetical protein
VGWDDDDDDDGCGVVIYIFVPRIMGEMRGPLTSRGLYGPLSYRIT